MPALTFFAVAATAIRGGIGVRAPALSLRATPAVSMGEADASLMELARRRDFQSFVAQARDEPSSVLQLVKDAGVAGAISYTAVELTFFAVALPVGYVAWHASTGEWLQPLLLLRGDDVEGKARLLGLLLSYVVLLKTLFPVRLGSHPPCQRHALGERRIEKESCVHRQHPPANAVHAAAHRRAHAAQRPGRGRPRIAQGGDPLAGGELARGRAPVRRGAAAALRRGARGAVCAQPDAGACSLALVLGDVGVRSHA